MEQALASCRRHWPHKAIYLGAQAHLQRFTPASVFSR
jgi:ElaA protein